MSKGKINIAYNEVISYDQFGNILHVNSNLADYDIHPWHTPDKSYLKEIVEKYRINIPHTIKEGDCEYLRRELDKFNAYIFENILDNTINTFQSISLEEVYEKGEDFIYPIILYTNDLFDRYETLELDSRVVERILQEKAKLCFIQATEGYLGNSDLHFEWIDRLSQKYNFPKNRVLVITANLKADFNFQFLLEHKVIKDTFTVYPFSYFQHDLWFARNYGAKALCKQSEENKRGLFKINLKRNKTEKKQKHFLCFNRIPRHHRILLFGEIQTNEKLKDKTIITLGKDLNNNEESFYNITQNLLEDDYKNSKQKILDFYKNYDCTQHSIFDVTNLDENQAATINLSAHNKTFLNIVSETLVDPYTIFFSEKIFKPIFSGQPFVLFGNPYSLAKLKEYGFQTFDRWWDESYDEETNLTRRLEKIVDTLEYVSKWDLDICYKVTQEMEHIFINNFNVLLSTEKVLKLHENLKN
jgi:uncharacterized Fe-S cluster protein YjdI